MSDLQFWQAFSELARAFLLMSLTGGIIALFLFAIIPLIKARLPKSAQYYLWVLALFAFSVPLYTLVSIPISTPMAPMQELLRENVKSTSEWHEELAQAQYGKAYEELEATEKIEIFFSKIGLFRGNFNNYILFMLIAMGGIIFVLDVIEYSFYILKLRRNRVPALKAELSLLPQKAPRLYRNPLAPTPMVIGIIRPVIYLPDRDYSEAQLKNILLHELCHLRRRDVLIKWIAALVVRVHWYNPLAWLMQRELDRACELACDEAVIKNLDNDGKQSYGDTLITMAAETNKRKMIASTTMCEEKKSLKERLGAIMAHKRFSRLAAAVSCALALAVLCATVALGAKSVDKAAAPEVNTIDIYVLDMINSSYESGE